MKKQVFYIHGGEPFDSYESFVNDLKNKTLWAPTGEVSKTWYQSLRDDLGGDYEMFSPQMPNKQNAKYEEWKIWFERHFEYVRDDVIFVGWSLGGIFLAKYLIENETPFTIRSLFLLAPPFVDGRLHEESGKSCEDFGTDITNIKELQNRVSKIIILHSKDDFAVPYEQALMYKEALPEAELITLEDKNHFLVEELPELVELIKNT